MRLFSRVKSEQEKNQLSFHLMKEKAPIDLELHSEKHNLRIQGVAKEGFVLSHLDGGTMAHLKNGKCAVRAVYKEQEYFFESVVEKDGDQFLLKFPQEIFRFQQRENFRHPIPLDFRSRICILALDERPMDVHFDVIDLNSHGCQVHLAVPLPNLRNGCHVRGNLELPKRKPLPFHATIRHISQKEKGTHLGLEFIAPAGIFLEHIQIFLLEVHLHLFNQRAA